MEEWVKGVSGLYRDEVPLPKGLWISRLMVSLQDESIRSPVDMNEYLRELTVIAAFSAHRQQDLRLA